MSTESNKAIVQRFYEAFNGRKLPMLDEIVTPDFIDHNPGPGQPAGMGSIETIKITSRKQEFIIPAAQMPVDVTLDPNVWLLFEGSVRQAAKSQGR